jgi:hypothetical protein
MASDASGRECGEGVGESDERKGGKDDLTSETAIRGRTVGLKLV